MHLFVVAMLLAATTFEFLVRGDRWHRWSILPGGVEFLPELMSGIAAALVILIGARQGFRYVKASYWLVFSVLLAVVICGTLANAVDPGATFAGARSYLRALPWFFVPAVFLIEEANLKKQLQLVLVVALIQLPLAVQQRVSTSAQGSFTGDFTSGTFLISSIMSIFLVAVACVLAALYFRKRISLTIFLILSFCVLLPTTINESKGTLALFPLGLLVSFIYAAESTRKWRTGVVTGALLAAFIAVFVPVYEHFNADRPYARPLSDLITDPDRLKDYLQKTEDIGTQGPVGRVDSVLVPLNRLAADPVKLAFGLGIGNASNSALGRTFVGKYFGTYGSYLVTSAGRLVLEIGVIGIISVLTLLGLIFSDCHFVSRESRTLNGAFAAGFAGVTAVIVPVLFYKEIIGHVSVSFLFWYFAGVVAAQRMRIV